MSECGTKVTIDTTEGDEALEQLEQHSSMVSVSVQSAIRKTYSTLVILGDLAGLTIPQWFNMMVGAVFMLASTYRTIAAAQATAGLANPAFFAQATISFIASTMLFAQGLALLRAKSEAEGEVTKIVSLLNVWSL